MDRQMGWGGGEEGGEVYRYTGWMCEEWGPGALFALLWAACIQPILSCPSRNIELFITYSLQNESWEN
jgi:hypothetical protein